MRSTWPDIYLGDNAIRRKIIEPSESSRNKDNNSARFFLAAIGPSVIVLEQYIVNIRLRSVTNR